MRVATLVPWALALAFSSADGHRGDGHDEEETEPHARRSWLERRGVVPEGAHRAAIRAHRELSKALDGPPPSALQAWKPLGPAPVLETANVLPAVKTAAGRATSIAIHPQNPAIAYVGYAGGGVWKTNDGGATWGPLTDGLTSIAIGALAIDPAAPDTLWVGTGEGDQDADCYAGHGIFKTTDGGLTWSQPAGTALAGASISRILLDPGAGAIWVSAVGGSTFTGDGCNSFAIDTTKTGLFKSIDGGATFVQLQKGQINDFLVDTTKTPRELVLARVGVGLSHFVDGTTASVAIAGLPSGSSKVARVGLTRSEATGVIFAAFGGPKAALGVYRAPAFGGAWTLLSGTPDWCGQQCFYDDVITVSPADPNVVLLGGSKCGVWRSADAMSDATTWKAPGLPGGACAGDQSNWYESNLHPDSHAVAFAPSDPSRVWVANDGGVAISTNAGTTFGNHVAGVATLELYGVCLDPSNPDVVLGGMQDNGYAKRTGDALPWTAISSGDGGHCVVTQPGVALISNQSGAVFRVTQGFQTPLLVFTTAAPCGALAGCGDRSAWEAPMAIDPAVTDNVYVGTHRLWRSTAAGKFGTWQAISPDLTAGKSSEKCGNGGAADDVLTAIAIAPTSSSTIFTGSASGLLQTTGDDGGSWTNLTAAPLPRRWVAGVAIDPNDAKVVDVAFSGFSGASKTPGHVFHSDDGGATFVLRDLPFDVSVNAILAHPSASGLLYVATDAGVLVTTDAGLSWIPLGVDLPPAPVSTIAFHAAAARLVVGTYGRSAWSMSFTPKLGAVTPATVELTATIGQAAAPTADLAIANDEPLGSTLDVDVAADAPWLTLDATTLHVAGAKAKHVLVTAQLAGKAVGSYDATIAITSASGTASVPVHLTIGALVPPGTGGGGGASGGAGAGGALGGAGGTAIAGAGGGAPVAAAPAPTSDGGCGCRTSPGRGRAGLVLATLVLALAVRRRRAR